MLILLMILITVISFLILLFKRNRDTFYFFMVCFSLAVFIIAELMYIAKKGGISNEVIFYYYLTNDVRLKFQYFEILLKNLGFLLAVGRFLFPYYLILLALSYSGLPIWRKQKWLYFLLPVLPVVSILFYQPNFFRAFIEPYPVIQGYVVFFSYSWPMLFTLIAIGLLIYEIVSIPIKFTKKYFISIVSFIISLSVLYLLYVRQDPAQVYQFYYSTYEWKHGLHYINTILSIPQYIVYLGVIVIAGAIGLISLTQYTHDYLEYTRDEKFREFEYNSIRTANAVFVHSIKNDLLANQVVLKRLNRALAQSTESDEAQTYYRMLQDNQDVILSKVNDMHKALKSNFLMLEDANLLAIVQEAIIQVQIRYPDVPIQVRIDGNMQLIVDPQHFTEVIKNILLNAIESTLEINRNPVVEVNASYTHQFTVIEIKDNGIGMKSSDIKKIFRPYVSNKKAKNNFGVGLTYVKTIVQEHDGRIHVSSKLNKGTVVSILLPKSK